MVLRIVRSKTQINIVSNTGATTTKVIWFSSLNNQERPGDISVTIKNITKSTFYFAPHPLEF